MIGTRDDKLGWERRCCLPGIIGTLQGGDPCREGILGVGAGLGPTPVLPQDSGEAGLVAASSDEGVGAVVEAGAGEAGSPAVTLSNGGGTGINTP